MLIIKEVDQICELAIFMYKMQAMMAHKQGGAAASHIVRRRRAMTWAGGITICSTSVFGAGGKPTLSARGVVTWVLMSKRNHITVV